MKPRANSILIFMLLFMFSTTTLHAQFNRYGGGLSFSTGIEEFPPPDRIETGNPAVTLRGVYDIDKKLFLIPSLSVYMPKKISDPGNPLKTFYTHINAHLGYKLAHEGPLMFYAIAGGDLTSLYLSYNTDDPLFESKLIPSPGLSVGTGIEMIVDDRFNAYTQVRYIVGKYQQLIISIGVHYYWDGRRYKTWK